MRESIVWSDMVWYGVVCSLAKMKNDCVNYGNVKLNGTEAKICSSRIRRKRYKVLIISTKKASFLLYTIFKRCSVFILC